VIRVALGVDDGLAALGVRSCVELAREAARRPDS
jgi:hypothetical protein